MLSGFDNTDTEKEEGEVQGGMVPGGGDVRFAVLLSSCEGAPPCVPAQPEGKLQLTPT